MEKIETLADIFKALSDPTRLRLLALLSGQSIAMCNGDCASQAFLCVGALANQLGVSQSAVSQHLRILRQAGLVRGERRGAFMHYSINTQGVEAYHTLAAQIMGKEFESG